MKIDCELSDFERDTLTLALTYAAGQFVERRDITGRAKSCLILMNKLFADSPDFRPYSEEAMQKFLNEMLQR